ncbi:DUF2157 domain-containing protein [Sphaerotilus mobilis]|uniref:Membrane protein DUF2157 n=1 Tax=Sphaerotilus mobilis TaxID=47994 RepID=A0A4Q7L9G9_9BURK|nr:DUF2157 domain-containing protein [Sphaerotilus mobilis]RZS46644.1 hypothetical protein EV685_4061 [Sphaerotilus mobilis]
MNITRPQLDEAVRRGLLQDGQADALWHYLDAASTETASLRTTHVLYYLGGLIAIGSMTVFMNMGWMLFGGWGLAGLSLAYALAGLLATERLLHRMKLRIPAGIVATFVVALTPLGVYGLQIATGTLAPERAYESYHRLIDWRWLWMELATLVVAAVMLWRYRLPFLVMPLALTLWYLSMDMVPFVFDTPDTDWAMRKFVSLWFGLLMTLLALWVDLRTRTADDPAFWLYLFGLLTFWSGLSLLRTDSQLDWFGYLCINVALLAIGTLLARRAFVVFGGLGVAVYLSQLTYEVFRESLLFPFVLTAVGFGIIGLGIVWQRQQARLDAWLRQHLPATWQDWLAQRR